MRRVAFKRLAGLFTRAAQRDRDSCIRGHSSSEVRSGKRGNALEEASVPSDDIFLHLCCESTIRLQMRNLAVSENWLATTRVDESCPVVTPGLSAGSPFVSSLSFKCIKQGSLINAGKSES